jgi:NAD+ diphosphatase
MADHMPFTGNPLDRAHNFRHDETWVAEQLANPSARFLLFSQLDPATHQSDPALVWINAAQRAALNALANAELNPLLLGLDGDSPCFALDVSGMPEPLEHLGLGSAGFTDTRSIATSLPAGEAGMLAQARSLIDWHQHHQFCAVCGAATFPQHGGSSRRCGSCQAAHFPRINPAVIMAIWHDQRLLLGRRRGRPPGNFSCIAGFVDPGESIEEAVAREALEEVGVVVDEVRYYASQPWPLSASLMIGCFAHAASDEAQVDDLEIAEARWFTREEVQAALDGDSTELVFPAPVAIAHHLVKGWAELA